MPNEPAAIAGAIAGQIRPQPGDRPHFEIRADLDGARILDCQDYVAPFEVGVLFNVRRDDHTVDRGANLRTAQIELRLGELRFHELDALVETRSLGFEQPLHVLLKIIEILLDVHFAALATQRG